MTGCEQAVFYHLLAQCFTYPTLQLVEMLKTLVGELRVELWDDDSGERAILPITPFTLSLATINQNTIRQLQQEHRRLFGEDCKNAMCPACAGPYWPQISPETLSRDVLRLYAEQGFDAPAEKALRLETELEFLAFLYCQNDGDTAVYLAGRNFLHEHALVWLLRFAAAVTAVTQSDFYRAATNLLTAFLNREAIARI